MRPISFRNTCAVTLCAALMLVACQSYWATPQPAQMDSEKTTTQCIEQIENAVQNEVGPRVRLTRMAFASGDRLVVVPSDATLDNAGLMARGNNRDRPDTFRLTVHKALCSIFRETSAHRMPLPACTCIALRN